MQVATNFKMMGIQYWGKKNMDYHGDSRLKKCYLMSTVHKMHALKQKGFLNRLFVWVLNRPKLHCHSFHVHLDQSHRSLLYLLTWHIYQSSTQVFFFFFYNCMQIGNLYSIWIHFPFNSKGCIMLIKWRVRVNAVL